MSWPDGERYSCPLQSLAVSLLLSLVSILFISQTKGVLSHLNFSSHRFPRFPPKNLCALVTLAMFSLVYAATDTFLQRLRTLVPGHISSHSALSSYGLFAPFTLWRLSVCTTSGRGPGEFLGFWDPWYSGLPPSLRTGREITTTSEQFFSSLDFFCGLL